VNTIVCTYYLTRHSNKDVHICNVRIYRYIQGGFYFQPRVCGTRCDICLQGFYNLQALNYQGCDPCFCFGISNECHSSIWGRMKVNPYILSSTYLFLWYSSIQSSRCKFQMTRLVPY